MTIAEEVFIKFRQDLRQLLYSCGVLTNPGWTENNIVDAFRKLLNLNPKPESEKPENITLMKDIIDYLGDILHESDTFRHGSEQVIFFNDTKLQALKRLMSRI
jgi:hypothetical protein